MKHELSDEEYKMIMDGADLGLQKANELAKKLSLETRKTYYVTCHSETFLVGTYSWYEVSTSFLFFFRKLIASFWAVDGKVKY